MSGRGVKPGTSGVGIMGEFVKPMNEIDKASDFIKTLRDDANKQQRLLHVCDSTMNALKAADMIGKILFTYELKDDHANLMEAKATINEVKAKNMRDAISVYCRRDCYRDACTGNEDVGIPDCPLAEFRPQEGNHERH